MVKQFRKPVEEATLEIPAGKLDSGENSFQCAVRELKEETGFTTKKMQHLFDFYTSPGFSNEIMHLFLAGQLVQGQSRPEEDEFVTWIKIPLEEAVAQAMSGQIQDGKTIVGLLAADKIIRREMLVDD